MSIDSKNKTHFGFKSVNLDEKEHLVAGVFDSVTQKYDLMNDLMSFGLHRLWKTLTLAATRIREGSIVLDAAAGTGDLAKQLARKVGPTGKVIMSDINCNMLSRGRDRLIDAGILGNVDYIQANVQHLPFQTNTFDCITIAFGLRNVTDKASALLSMYEVLKPGGQLLILEFSHPRSSLMDKLYHLYSFKLIPKIGEWIAKDKNSYQYLVESIRMHPKQEELKAMMQTAGFEDVTIQNFCDGIVALHSGYKY